jgi:L-asparaginase
MTGPGKRHKVLVLYVGGTIGMWRNDYGSLEPKRGFLRQEMLKMSDLQLAGMPEFEILEYENLVDSSDARPSDWVRMAKDIHDRYFQYDGFLVAHGTDTMHYTASALSFLLSNLGKPVIITGAMIPLIEPYNDARRNLIAAMMFAGNPAICEVCIYFNHLLLRGNRSKKVSMTVSAFESPSCPPLAEIGGHNFRLNQKLLLPRPTGPVGLHPTLSPAVLYFSVGTDFEADSVLRFVSEATTKSHCHSVILELCGIGSEKSSLVTFLKTLSELGERTGTMVAVTSQNVTGGLPQTDVRKLAQWCPRVVRLGDMTTEAAIVKAMYLFGRGLSLSEVKKWMTVNIRGELSQQWLHANL